MKVAWLAALGLLLGPWNVTADEVTVSGTVVDASGKPVAGAVIADWWLMEKGALRADDAVSDAQGRFSLKLDMGGRGAALLAVDPEQKRGSLLHLSKTDVARPVTFHLTPLITVRGEYFCEELNEAPVWCNTQVWFTTNRFRIMECRSHEARFELRLPAGEYNIDGYAGEEMKGFKRRLVLTTNQMVQDLGRIIWTATPMGRAAGKPSPAWNITEARGMSKKAKVSSFRGKWMLLDFWGYWCGPCVSAMPGLFDFYDKHQADRDAFEIIAIHNGAASLKEMDEKLQGTIRGLWKGRTLPFPVIVDAGETTFTNFGVNSYPTQLLIDPDGRVVRDGSESLLASILDSRKAANLPVALSADGQWIAVGNEQGTVRLHSSSTTEFKVDTSAVNCIAVTRDGKRLATGARDGTIAVWEMPAGRKLMELQRRGQPVFALAFSPDGERLASGSFDTTRVWNLRKRSEDPAFGKRLFPSWSIAFSPDGRKLAAGGCGAVVIWNAETGTELATGVRRGGAIHKSLGFSPDGRSLVSGAGGIPLIWNADSAKLERELSPTASEIVAVAFSPDGQSVTALSRGRAIRSWRLSGGSGTAVPETNSSWARLVAKHLPDDAAALAQEAWKIALRRDASKIEYELAQATAERAVALAPKDEFPREALGAALYRTGRFGPAVQALEEGARLKVPDDADRWSPPTSEVYLTLSLYRDGNVERAREKLMSFWGRWWGDDNEATLVFEEANELFFGGGARAARPVVLAPLRGGTPAAEVAERISTYPAFDEQGRAAASRILPFATALQAVEQAQRKIGLRDRVVQAVQESKDISPEWRAAALSVARNTKENADQLNSSSWDVVKQSNLTRADYDLALAQAEAAYRLEPQDAIRNTLGVALYRTGRFDEAIQKLSESERNNANGIANETDLPFLAMAFHKLGKTAEAQKRFRQLTDLLSKENEIDDVSQGFLAEVQKQLGVEAELGAVK